MFHLPLLPSDMWHAIRNSFTCTVASRWTGNSRHQHTQSDHPMVIQCLYSLSRVGSINCTTARSVSRERDGPCNRSWCCFLHWMTAHQVILQYCISSNSIRNLRLIGTEERRCRVPCYNNDGTTHLSIYLPGCRPPVCPRSSPTNIGFGGECVS